MHPESRLIQNLYHEITMLQHRFDAMSELMHREDDRVTAFYEHYEGTLAALTFVTDSLQLFSQKVSYQQVMLLNLLQTVAEKAGVDLDLEEVLPTMPEFEGVLAVAREEKASAENYTAKAKALAAEREKARIERDLLFVKRNGFPPAGKEAKPEESPAADAAPAEEEAPSQRALDPALIWAFENAPKEG